jgi:catechol 2,3-dioxygenase-like lactoylglutathione lyase family enzyme
MALERIDHYLLQTTDLAATRDWYVKVLGMREGPHPDFKFPVVWLYLGDKDAIHAESGVHAGSPHTVSDVCISGRIHTMHDCHQSRRAAMGVRADPEWKSRMSNCERSDGGHHSAAAGREHV